MAMVSRALRHHHKACTLGPRHQAIAIRHFHRMNHPGFEQLKRSRHLPGNPG
jgi:hypothetical protein